MAQEPNRFQETGTVGTVLPKTERLIGTISGAVRKGPPFQGSRSSKEMKIQNASCQMGVVAKLQGDKTASFCKEMSGREVTGR